MDDGGVPGLRERKKAETREAISRAAARLALQHGPENVRVADIAAEADVSPRTYNNYFASIPEAICAGPSDRALAFADAVRRRPVDEPLEVTIADAIIEVQSDSLMDRALVRMMIHTPALRGEFFKAVVARDAALAEVIAERTGCAPGDLYPELLAATISSVTRVVSRRWMNDETADFGVLLREALAMVAPMIAERKISGHQVA
ncbi:MAG: TetR family transcriptional regulator [Streptosporangiaceae bacterium]|jgi:AcrR family transcriptional regulator